MQSHAAKTARARALLVALAATVFFAPSARAGLIEVRCSSDELRKKDIALKAGAVGAPVLSLFVEGGAVVAKQTRVWVAVIAAAAAAYELYEATYGDKKVAFCEFDPALLTASKPPPDTNGAHGLGGLNGSGSRLQDFAGFDKPDFASKIFPNSGPLDGVLARENADRATRDRLTRTIGAVNSDRLLNEIARNLAASGGALSDRRLASGLEPPDWLGEVKLHGLTPDERLKNITKGSEWILDRRIDTPVNKDLSSQTKGDADKPLNLEKTWRDILNKSNASVWSTNIGDIYAGKLFLDGKSIGLSHGLDDKAAAPDDPCFHNPFCPPRNSDPGKP